MEPQTMSQRNRQRERVQRGSDFQEEIRRSWRLVPNVWRMRIADGGGTTRPADEIVLTNEVNILAEHKRTESMKFALSFLRPNQIQGLVDFDEVLERNYGLVFVSFLNEGATRDTTFVFRLITALKWMKKRRQQYIHLETFTQRALPCLEIKRIEQQDLFELSEVPTCCKFL